MIERHRAFWDCSPEARPLCDFFVGGVLPLATYHDGLREGPLAPEMIIPEAWEILYSHVGHTRPRQGELVDTVYPLVTLPWLEAILGCPVKVSLTSHSMGTEPYLDDLSQLDAVEAAALDPANPWFLKLLEFQRYLITTFGSQQPVGLPVMRGPLDLATAMLGGARTLYEFYDHPTAMEHLLRVCADVWLHVARAQMALIPAYAGGFFSYRLLWTPRPSPVLQEDSTAFLSPALYRQFVLPQDERILAEFTYPCFHTHSASMGIVLDGLLACPSVKAIDSCWDPAPFGPPVETLIPAYHRIQEAGKSLYILATGCPTQEELLLLCRELSPRGLCVFFEAQDETVGRYMLERMAGAWQGQLPGVPMESPSH
ncbi:MAG TPA: uroporphyrinogen decarboxylase family protein [Anaerolineae bacterium]|nr:uroporphyrinogen decarboxylase family protein [Anaerolineae bacterium]HOQ98602.1 uroporphyrinogen decarboxylase family protein [Anaerolineae bacterium]